MKIKNLIPNKLIQFFILFLKKKDKKLDYQQNKKNLLIVFIGLPVLFSLLYFYSVGRKRYFVRSHKLVIFSGHFAHHFPIPT